MSKLMYITLLKSINNTDCDNDNFWLEHVIDTDVEINGILKKTNQEYLYYVFCGGRCVSSCFPATLKAPNYHEKLEKQNKIDYNLLLRKIIGKINAMAKISKILLYESEMANFKKIDIEQSEIDSILSQWNGNCIYKVRCNYSDFKL